MSYVRNILFLLFISFSSFLFSQEVNNSTAVQLNKLGGNTSGVLNIRTPEDSVQSGSATIENGTIVIKLEKQIPDGIYDVAITPQCSNCGEFIVSNKGQDSFTIQHTGTFNSTASFTFTVYRKKVIYPAGK